MVFKKVISTIKRQIEQGSGDLESVLGKMGFNFRVQSRKASKRQSNLSKDL